MRCWWCGVEPNTWVDTTMLDSPFETRAPGPWPSFTDGHSHALEPPTPGQLEQAGHEALMRIQHAMT